MTMYVQSQDSATWHWCRNCSCYPKRLSHRQSERPSWNLCDECKQKERDGDCRA